MQEDALKNMVCRPGASIRLALTLMFCASLVSGCASYQQTRAILQDTPEGLPSFVQLDSVPFVAQDEYYCGPSALSMMLQTQGATPELNELVSMVYVPSRNGSFQIELKAAARRFEMIPYELSPQLEDVFREVAAGNPVLVLQNLGLSLFPTWHYAVVVGYDLPRKEVILHSGLQANERMALGTFERTWLRQSSGWSLVILPPSLIPETATPLAYQRSLEDLFQIGKTDIALDAYNAAVEHWSDNTNVYFGKGNLLYALNEYEEASEAFLLSISADMNNAFAWNNLSYSLAQLGCDNAHETANCASRIAPDTSAFNSTLKDIRALRKNAVANDLGCPSLPSCPVKWDEPVGDIR